MATNKTTTNKVLLQYLVEQGTQAKVVAANNAIKQSMKQVENAYKVGGAVGASELRRITKNAKKLTSELLDIESGFHDVGATVPRELQDVIDKVERLNKSIKQGTEDVRDLDEEFSRTSKAVSLAGDFESQSQVVANAIGTVGGTGIQRGISTVSEFPAVVEALPKLKASAAGLPAAINVAAKSLGPVGFGLGAVAGLTAIAVSGLVSEMNKQAEAARGIIAAEEQFQTLRITGTEEDVQAAIDANNTQMAIAAARRDSLMELKALEDARNAQQRQNENNLFMALARGIADISGSDAAETYGKEIQALNDEILTLSTSTAGLVGGLAASEFAIETAIQAEQRLANERTQAGLAAIAFAENGRQRILMERGLLEMSTEQQDARNKAIADETLAISLALRRLQESGQSTDEIIAQIDSYNAALQELAWETRFLETTSRPLAAVREAEAAAIEAQAEKQQKAIELAKEETDAARKRFEIIKDTLEKQAALEKSHADELITISQKAAEEAEKALSQLEQKLGSLNQTLGRDLAEGEMKQRQKVLEAQIEAQREEVKEKRNHYYKLDDIRRKADQDELGLRQKRDFQAVANSRRAARIAIEDEQRNFSRSEDDRIEQQKQEAEDRQRSFIQERRDRLQKFRQDVYDARVAFQQQRNEQQIANAQAIMQARAKHRQELMDIQQAGIQALTIRRQISDAEIQMMSRVAQTIGGLFSQISSFTSFAGGNTTNNNRTANNTVNVNANASQSGLAIASGVVGILRRLTA